MSTTQQGFRARYRGRCAKTGKTILPGDLIAMHKGKAVLVRQEAISIDVYEFGDNEYIRNARGRCEDAPCCGCCTI